MDNCSFLRVVCACDNFPYGPTDSDYYELYLPGNDQPYGLMLSEIVKKMPWTRNFEVNHASPRRVKVLDSSHGKNTAQCVNSAFQELIDISIDQDLFHVLDGRHSEPFALLGASYEAPVSIERFATSLFGLTTRGVHLVAYTKLGSKIDRIWVSRRAKHLFTYSGMLDTTVAGGLKSGVPPLQAVLEEADEEASFDSEYVQAHVRCHGVLSHMSLTGKGIPGEQGLVNPDYIYVYDMELSELIPPKPHDDEVDCFYSMTVDEVKAALLNEEFKPDSGAVLVDFLIRHSIITPENEENFVEINMRLHRRLPFPIA